MIRRRKPCTIIYLQVSGIFRGSRRGQERANRPGQNSAALEPPDIFEYLVAYGESAKRTAGQDIHCQFGVRGAHGRVGLVKEIHSLAFPACARQLE